MLGATLTYGTIFCTLPGFDPGFRTWVKNTTLAARLFREQMAHEQGGYQRFIELMKTMKGRLCGDPRDKVLGPLVYATDVMPYQIAVDNRKDIVEVYTSLRKLLLSHRATAGLEVLCLVITATDEQATPPLQMVFLPRIPSWVPDWRSRSRIGRLADSTTPTVDGLLLYNPCPGTEFEAYVFGTELELKCLVARGLSITVLTPI